MKKLFAACVTASFLVLGAGPAVAGVLDTKVKVNNVRVCNNRCLVDTVDIGILN